MGVDIAGIGEGLTALKGLADKIWPDKTEIEKTQLAGQLATDLAQLQAVTAAQTDINKVEASNVNLFVAGWRPYVGWVCGTGLGMDCIVRPLVNWISALAGHPVDFPVMSNVLLQSTMAGLLGLGHISRTYEKVQGVQNNH